MREKRLSVLLLLFTVSAAATNGQEHAGVEAAISVGAMGRVEIPADYAILTIGVQVRDSTPTLAATAMDDRIGMVIDTLEMLGFSAESLPTAHYHVTPIRDRERARIIGYDANSSVRATVRDFDILPAVIEAALAAGATDASGLQFGASDQRGARDEALRRAIAEARSDAEVIAAAAGGRLGQLLEVSTQSSPIPQARALEFSGVGARGPQITPRSIAVVANVSVRWAFVETQ
jgi:uncharacterized protein YggE